MREAREVIEAALKANEIDMVPCDRCDGRGYHHGFGEHGHDPDWCVKCDGAQTVHSGVEPPDAILAALSSAGIDCEGWRTIESAKKDRTVIWAALHPDIYPRIEPERKDLERWNGVQICLQHPGVYEKDGRAWDHGWWVAAPVGNGGIPDEWIAGWRPLPPLASGGG